MNPLVTICARKNSKRLPGKNTRMLHGKPLYKWTFDVANQLELPVVVSTDDHEISKVARFFYNLFTVNRPDHLDDVGKMSQIRDAVTIVEHRTNQNYNPIIDLDITNPMRTADHVLDALTLFELRKPPSVVSVTKARKSPDFNQIPIQHFGVEWDMNASIYVYDKVFLYGANHPVNDNTEVYVMPAHTFCDIDTLLDFQIVEFLMEKYGYVEASQVEASQNEAWQDDKVAVDGLAS